MSHWRRPHDRVSVIAGSVMLATLIAGSAPAIAQEEEVPLIYAVQVAGPTGFHGYLARGGEAAADNLGVEFVSIFPDQPDLAQQLNKFQEAIAAQPDGIIINCGLGPDEAYLDLIAQANGAGIPVGCSAAPPPGSGVVKTPGDPFLFRVGSDEYSAGVVTARRLIDLGATGRVLINQQQPQDVTCNARAEGEKVTLEEAGITAEIIQGAMDPGQDAELITQYLRANPDTTAATSVCNVIDGLLAAKEQSGRTDLIISGYDVVSQSLEAIKDGRQAFTIDQQQYWRGYIPVLLMAHYLKYGLYQANYFLTGPSVVDASNVEQVADLVTAPAPGPYR
jgi:simple sugar transport system substrate-binding protein